MAGRRADQRGDLVPVDAGGESIGYRLQDPQPGQLSDAPLMHERVLVVNDLVCGNHEDHFHLSSPGALAGRCGLSVAGLPQAAVEVEVVAVGLAGGGGVPVTGGQ